jgi:hypothetical protein
MGFLKKVQKAHAESKKKPAKKSKPVSKAGKKKEKKNTKPQKTKAKLKKITKNASPKASKQAGKNKKRSLAPKKEKQAPSICVRLTCFCSGVELDALLSFFGIAGSFLVSAKPQR